MRIHPPDNVELELRSLAPKSLAHAQQKSLVLARLYDPHAKKQRPPPTLRLRQLRRSRHTRRRIKIRTEPDRLHTRHACEPQPRPIV